MHYTFLDPRNNDKIRAARHLSLSHPPHGIDPELPWVLNIQRGSLHAVSVEAAFIVEHVGDGATYDDVAALYDAAYGAPLARDVWDSAVEELRQCALIQ